MTLSTGVRAAKRYDSERLNQSLPVLVTELNALEVQFREAQQALVERVIGRRLPVCNGCGRMMFPRRMWNKTSRVLRKALRPFAMSATTRTRCGTCYMYEGRDPLSPDELERLQRQVGIL